MDCPNLTSITIPSSVTSIGNGAFSASGLKSITIPSSVKTINLRAFRNCTELASVTIGSGVTSIGEAAFANCTSLTSVTIPRKVESIDFDAFYGCESLKSFTIGSGVKSIGSGVVSNCPSLLDIFCESDEKENHCAVIFKEEADADAVLKAADSFAKKYGRDAVVFTGTGEEKNFLIAGPKAQELLKELKERFQVKGGGRGELVRGRVRM